MQLWGMTGDTSGYSEVSQSEPDGAWQRAPGTICVAAILKDEDVFVEEWVAYHRLLGVDHFYLYDNDPRQPLNQLLAQHRDYVTVRPWLVDHDDPRYPGRTKQIKAYRHCLEHGAARHDWVAFIDCDEFIALEQHRDLKAFLAEFDSYDSIALNWHVFGHNGHYDDPPGLVIECLTRRMKEPRAMTKSLSRPDAIAAIENAHLCGMKAGRTRVDANKRLYTEALYPGKTRVARINHYQCRSFTNWMRKPERGEVGTVAEDPANAWRFSEEGCLRQFVSQIALNKNEYVDTSMLRHVEPVKRYLRQLAIAGEAEQASSGVIGLEPASASKTESHLQPGMELQGPDGSFRIRLERRLRLRLLSIQLLLRDLRHAPRFLRLLLAGELGQVTAMVSYRRQRNAYAYATAASKANDWPEAATRWQRFVDEFGDDASPAAYAALCKAHHRRGDLPAAEDAAQRGRSKYPTDTRLAMALARIAAARESWSDAATRWQAILDRLDGDTPPEVYRHLSIAKRRQGNIDQADEVLRRGLVAHPQDLRLATRYAELATARKQWADAFTRWQAVLDKSNGGAPTQVHCQISHCLEGQGKIEEAEEVLRQVLAANPTDMSLGTRYAELATLQQHWPDALARWNAMLNALDGSAPAEVYLQISRAHREQGSMDEAEKVVRRGLAKRSDEIRLLTELGKIGEARRNWRQVDEASNAAIEIIEAGATRVVDDRDFARVCHWLMRGQSYDRLLVALRNLRRREGNTRLLLSIEGLAYLRSSQMERARVHWASLWQKAKEDRTFALQPAPLHNWNGSSQDSFAAVSRRDVSIAKPTGRSFCVYTALFGEYDELRSPTYMPAGVKFICFSDRARDVAGWEVRIIDLDLKSPAMKNRLLKLLPYDYLEDFDCSLYIDANVVLLADPLAVYHRWLEGKPFVAWSHPDRSGVYEEIEAILVGLRHSPAALLDQHRYFRESTVPERTGLIDASFLWRDHRDAGVRRLMEEAWEFLVRFGCHRDQPALGYLMWRSGVRPDVLPDSLGTSRENDFFCRLPHKQTALDLENATRPRAASPAVNGGVKDKPKDRSVSFVRKTPARMTWVCRDAFRSTASTVMRGEQLSEMARLRLDDVEVSYIDESELSAKSESVLILTKGFLKGASLDDLAELKRRGNIICADYVDDKARSELHDCIDVYVAASMAQFVCYSKEYADKLVHLITHHADPRLDGTKGPEDRCNIGYFGEIANACYSVELQGIVDFCHTNTRVADATWIPKLRDCNVHYSVRRRREIDGFKPFLKGFTAAQCRSNIIVPRDESDARYYLGADYPFILKDESLTSVLEMIEHVKASFGGPEWRRGLEIMKSVRQRCNTAQIAGELQALLARCR